MIVRFGAAMLIAVLLADLAGSDAAARSPVALGHTTEPADSVDMRVVDQHIATFGHAPALWSLWSNWGSRGGDARCSPGKGSCAFPSEAAAGLGKRGITPFIWWAPVAPPGEERGQYARYKRIINGVHDDYMRTWARAAKVHGGAVVLRFAHEMNGKWYPWSLSRYDNGPKRFKKAWRHVWRLFREVGATNVRFLWNPMPERCLGCVPHYRFESFYPGNRYVDYVGVNIYNRSRIGWKPMAHILERPLARLRKLTRTSSLPRGKPVILGEVATDFRGGSKAQWLKRGYQQTFRRWPQVKAIVYFDVDMRRRRHLDWRLIRPKGGSAVRAYRQLVALPRFQGRIR